MPAPSRLRLGVLEGMEIITMGLIRGTLPRRILEYGFTLPFVVSILRMLQA